MWNVKFFNKYCEMFQWTLGNVLMSNVKCFNQQYEMLTEHCATWNVSMNNVNCTVFQRKMWKVKFFNKYCEMFQWTKRFNAKCFNVKYKMQPFIFSLQFNKKVHIY